MRPPYDPAHVERVTFGRKPPLCPLVDRDGRSLGGFTPDSSTVVAQCSCGFRGGQHPLSEPGAARLLAADLNGHRETYVEAVSA